MMHDQMKGHFVEKYREIVLCNLYRNLSITDEVIILAVPKWGQ